MHINNRIVSLFLLPAFLVATSAFAQQARVVDTATMRQALVAQADTERAQRDQVTRVLSRADARDVAASMGLSVVQANAAVATLTGAELSTAAQQAAAVETAALAGGANTVVISVTTLLLILIIVILLAK